MEDKYAVRASRDDEKSQVGKYHVLANAVKKASDFSLNVYDLETGNLVFEHSSSKVDDFINQLRGMNRIVLQDNKEGHQWKYSNKTSRKAKDFDSARRQGKYLTNCCDGVHWGMKKMTPGIPANALSWFGAKGGSICWCSKTAEREARKYFDIIQTDCKKTVRQLVNNGTIRRGDTLTYVTMNHTNAYLGDNQSFDTGHAYCSGSGENAAFKKWIGSLSCGGHKVGCIVRFKESVKGYRVQVGAYSTAEMIQKAQTLCKNAGFDTFTENIGGVTRVFCGSYSVIANAVERLEQVWKIDKLFEKAYIRGI